MPRRRYRDPPLVRLLQSFDAFGYELGFNLEREAVFKTLPGACCSVFIVAWCFVVVAHLLISINRDNLDRPLSTRVLSNYFQEDLAPHTQDDGFFFAIGLSSPHNFSNLPPDISRKQI